MRGTNELGVDRVSGELRREHWNVPVRGLTPSDPGGTVETTAHRDGTVTLLLTCGDHHAQVRLDVCRAAQLSTGIWEAAGVAQHLTTHDQPTPAQPAQASEELPRAERAQPSAPPRDRALRRPRRPPANQEAARDAMRTIGLLIRRTRQNQDKSLRVISGLAGMSRC